MGRKTRLRPVDYTDAWPFGDIEDPAARTAQGVAVALSRAVAGRSVREVGRHCEVDPTSISGIISGAVWPDLRTLARLEAGLGCVLWPSGGAVNAATVEPVSA